MCFLEFHVRRKVHVTVFIIVFGNTYQLITLWNTALNHYTTKSLKNDPKRLMTSDV